MDTYRKKVLTLKAAIMAYQRENNRHYGDLTRPEQSVEDLCQALYLRLDRLLMCLEDGCDDETPEESGSDRVVSQLLQAATKLSRGGDVHTTLIDDFEKTLQMLDQAADLKRKSETAKDVAETAAIKHKRSRS